MPTVTYEPYANARFGFSVDVPSFFVASPPPTNGDGQEWTWGTNAQMTAWGMYNSASLPVDCDATRKGVTARRATASSCWLTGKESGKIYWEKTVLAGGGDGRLYGLTLEYDERLKEAFDPVVAHVNASWQYPR
jgi:hypothetical protein